MQNVELPILSLALKSRPTLLFYVSTASAAPISYGDFIGTSVQYLDVIETANSPDDDEPLYGTPQLIGNTLDSDPRGFLAQTTSGANFDFTDGEGAPDVFEVGMLRERSDQADRPAGPTNLRQECISKVRRGSPDPAGPPTEGLHDGGRQCVVVRVTLVKIKQPGARRDLWKDRPY